MAGSKIVSQVTKLVKEPIENLGLTLWDVRFVKEGASYYLRVFIDKPDGINIDDCTNVSHAIDPILEEADPIDVSYYLEVCSPGLNRELKTEEHFLAFVGSEILLTLYKAENGSKTVRGVLKEYNNGPIMLVDGVEKSYASSAVAKATLCDLD